MGWLREQLEGNLFLGYRALIAHPLKKLFARDERTGRERFLSNYAAEGLLPLTAEDRSVLRGASRCIHCGLCDATDRLLSTAPRWRWDGPSLLPLSFTRATPDMPRARTAMAQVSPEELLRAEAVCPTRVPLRELAELVGRKLEELDRYGAR